MHRPTLLALALAATWSADAAAQIVTGPNCSAPEGQPTGHIAWPADDPVWEFDFIRLSRSTGSEGSGIEIRDVRYNGRLILNRGHAPIINVLYDPGGCGCYRDWFDQESVFRAPNPLPGQNCIALPPAGDVVTTCENGGVDTGSFNGVAVEDYGDELVLTGHASAGWYRYEMKWHFYLNGDIWPEFAHGATPSSCTTEYHTHHAYWRLDFDLDGAGGDRVREVNPADGTNAVFPTEVRRTWGDPDDGVYWVAEDPAAGMAYAIVPSAADLLVPVEGVPGTFDDDFAHMDAAVLRYNPDEIDDGVGFQGGSSYCAIDFEDDRPNGVFLNGEDVEGEDVVFWYRSGARHEEDAGFRDNQCLIVGPTLRPVRSGLDLQATALDPLTVAQGGQIEFQYTVANSTQSAVTGDLFFRAQPGGIAGVIRSGTLPAGQTVAGTFTQQVPGNAPPGTYTYALNIGQFPGVTVDTETFTITVTGSEMQAGTEAEPDAWTVTAAAPWVAAAPAASAAGPVLDELATAGYVLQRATPNPFNPTTTVRFAVAEAQRVTLALYDVTGRRVATLFEGQAEGGRSESVRVDGSALPAGTYVVRLEGEAVRGAMRIVLLR